MIKAQHMLLGIFASSLVVGGLQAQGEQQTTTLKFKSFKTFNFVLPKETWTPISGTVPLRHPNGASFRAMRDGLKLSVDTTGNGKPNKDVKGSKGYLQFRSKADGETFRYAARFKGSTRGFTFASSCALVGSVGGAQVKLFDLNNNGSFDEVGTDGILVGKGKAVAYLSKVISHGGKLLNFEVDGNTVTTTPYDGESGSISVVGGFRGRGKLEAAIISDGQNSFNVAGMASLTVPVGDYTLVAGLIKKGPQSARIRAGKMSPLAVKAEKHSKLSWGGPVIAEFTHTLADSKVTVEPTDLKYYGKAGEEYYDLYPNAKSPKFTARNPETGKGLGNFIFSGC